VLSADIILNEQGMTYNSQGHHYLLLHRGKFYLFRAGSPIGSMFKDDTKAFTPDHAIVITQIAKLADTIVRIMEETGVYELVYSSSCNSPEEQGRPLFERCALDARILSLLEID
jgi:hypothetical protein